MEGDLALHGPHLLGKVLAGAQLPVTWHRPRSVEPSGEGQLGGEGCGSRSVTRVSSDAADRDGILGWSRVLGARGCRDSGRAWTDSSEQPWHGKTFQTTSLCHAPHLPFAGGLLFKHRGKRPLPEIPPPQLPVPCISASPTAIPPPQPHTQHGLRAMLGLEHLTERGRASSVAFLGGKVVVPPGRKVLRRFLARGFLRVE